jgi:predicted porin
MKRTLIAAAAVLAAGTAFAQSSVTLYGRINTSVERQKDSLGNKTVLQDSNSRWGLRGSEDLGGGLKGLFVLESGFGSDTGLMATIGAIFARESWVGLEGNFGRVRLGNMGQPAAYYAIADYISMHNHDTGTSSDAFIVVPGFKQNNISYNTPSFGGLVIEAQYGLKETVVGGKNSAVVAANYDKGPLHLGLSYTDGPLGSTLQGALSGAAGVAREAKEVGARALYEFGPVTVGAYAIYDKGEDSLGAEAKRMSYRGAVMYTLGASEFHLNVGFADKVKRNGVKLADTDALQYTVAYNYNLSKRTKVYAFYTRIENKTAATYTNFGTVAPGFDPSSIAVGVRHAF